MKTSVPGMENLELRWTGGWVRDKLLGVQSHDIDVALSTMTGEQFGQALKNFMQEHGQKYVDEAKAHGINSSVKDLHKIAANPEKSKHLETITTKMFGIEVDFVNLRKEVYDENSRNPQMEFGTPEEDALRRDATVNALFYNLDSSTVEDFTNRGLQDMAANIIRTPLAPYKTFRDDPLRVLRLIRFASRLGYGIEETALLAMKDPTIHEALRLKISRERVGVEVGKIVAGPDPLRGLMLIYDRDMFATVFANPTSNHDPNSISIPQVYKNVRKLQTSHQPIREDLRFEDDMSLTWYLATYVPWNFSEKEAVLAAREGIKGANTVTKVLGDAVKQRSKIQQVVKAANNGQLTRVLAGITLRNAGLAWRYHVLYSLLCDATEEDFETVVGEYEALFKFLHNEDLMDAANLKPIVNGNEIREALGVSKAGSWLKTATDMVVEWQFTNPTGTADGAKSMLTERRNELKIG